MRTRAAFSALGMTPARYLATVAAPTLFLALAFVLVVSRLAGPTVPLLAVPVVVTLLLVAYPFMRAAEASRDIEDNIHYFITHLGVLATSNIPRARIFAILGEKREYGRIAREALRIHALVTRWNVSLADAARFTGRRTPSRLFEDFLARLAHALDSGEDFPAFLRSEQLVVMQDYANAYRRKLYGVEVFKAIYNSLVMSLAFLFIFAMLLPVLGGMDGAIVLAVALGGAGLIEASLLLLARSRAPTDPLWPLPREGRKIGARALAWIGAGVAGALVALGFALVARPALPLSVALVAAPLALGGVAVARLERVIERREENYAAFVRSLGASAATHGGQLKVVLRTLERHDFGPLRVDLRRLNRRLALRANDERAWTLFGRETGSRLILLFNRMFEEGIKLGGSPEAIGDLLSDNFGRLVALRKERAQAAATFRGLAFGLVVALAAAPLALEAALAVGLGIVGVLGTSLSSFDVSPETTALVGISFSEADPRAAGVAIVVMLVGHSLAAALITARLRGSHPARGLLDFAVFTAAASGVVWLTGGAFMGVAG